jgi:glycosyltransferase involved in cell wall biosynthesis
VKLSICIPTYNRLDALKKQINFLKNEVLNNSAVEIVVSDNASSDGTRDYLNEAQGLRANFNITNLGINGNLTALAMLARGDYIWFVGDDDILFPGVVPAILRSLSAEPDLVFLNHGIHNLESDIDDLFYLCKIIDEHDFNRTLLGKRFGQLMFITAAVHKRRAVLKITSKVTNVASPLLLTLNSLKSSNLKLVRDVYLINDCLDITWRDQALDVFAIYIPLNIVVAYLNGFDLRRSSRLLIIWALMYWKHFLGWMVFRIWHSFKMK